LKRKAEWVKLSVRTSVIPQHILPGHFGRARGHFGARSVAYFAEIRILFKTMNYSGCSAKKNVYSTLMVKL